MSYHLTMPVRREGRRLSMRHFPALLARCAGIARRDWSLFLPFFRPIGKGEPGACTASGRTKWPNLA
jgi:hypothetical protein